MRTISAAVSAQALSVPLFLQDLVQQIPPSLQTIDTPLSPSILVFLSSGASLTYNVEVTGVANPVNASGEAWNTADSGSALTASVNLTLVGAVIAVRLNVTTYSSGTATIFLIQP